MINNLLWAISIWLIIRFLFVPIIVLVRLRFPVREAYPATALDAFISAQGQSFLSLHSEILTLGFVPDGATDAMPGGARACLYWHPNDPGMVALTFAPAPVDVMALSFIQDFVDGRSLSVVSSAWPSPLPSRSRITSYNFPGLSPVALFQRFVRIRSKVSGRAPLHHEAGSLLLAAERSASEQNLELTQRGLYTESGSPDKLRPTILGAYIISWRSAWPVTSLLLMLDTREAKSAAAET
jgi:hypothetical protein